MAKDDNAATVPRLPESGPGSAGGWPRRFAALFADWIAANLIAYVVTGGETVWDPQSGAVWAPLACWYVLVVVTTALTGASLGQAMFRIRVAHLDGRRISPITAAVRTLLIALVIPPIVFTSEGRGLHDLASNTVVVKV